MMPSESLIQAVDESMVRVSHPHAPSPPPTSPSASTSSIFVTSSIQTQSESLHVEERSIIVKEGSSSSSSTQTTSDKTTDLTDQATNTMNQSYVDCAVQTDIPQEVKKLSLDPVEVTSEKIETSLKALPLTPSSPLPIPVDHLPDKNSPENPLIEKKEEVKVEVSSGHGDVEGVLSRGNSSYQYVMDPANMKISFMEFNVGDIALFVPIDERKEKWMAFHSNRPHRYLAQVKYHNLSIVCDLIE